MKPISIHVPEDGYEELKALAATRRAQVAQLIIQRDDLAAHCSCISS